MYSRSDRDGYHEQRVTATDGSTPLHHCAEGHVGRIIVWHYQLAYMHTSSLTRSVHCVKALGVNYMYVPNSLAMSPGPNTVGSHIRTYTCWCQHDQHYSVLKH